MQTDLLAAHPADATALIESDRSVTYGELTSLVAGTAGGLRSIGVGPGDRVAILAPNDLAFVIGFLAAQNLGAVACPISHQNPETVLALRFSELDPAALIVGKATAELGLWATESGLIDPSRAGTPAGCPSDDIAPLPDGPAVDPVDVDPAATSTILHTSGIVGAPRAAVLTAQNMAAAQQRIIAAGPGLSSDDITLAALPFPHVLGLNMCLLPSLRAGATVVLQQRWHPQEALELIARHGVSHVVGVPPMWAALCSVAQADPEAAEKMASVTFARAGASSLSPSVAETVQTAFGLELAQGYGLTETAGTVTFEETARLNPGSVGRPLPDVELKLVEDGNEVEPGDRGEVWIRTGSVFEGYLADAPATAEVLISDGWLRTGDIGIQDDDGTLYLVGREKDLINVSGFNVYPAEVEEVLETHPSVAEAVVVGEAHEVSGERVVAYLTANDGDGVDIAAVADHCRQYLSRYKVPTAFHVVERLPLTATGKRVRKELR